MTLTGKVLTVTTLNLGEPAVAAASVGATTLYVADASTFDENGGLININGETVAYLTNDVELDTLTLSVPLVTAVADQDMVEVSPAAPIKTALVSLGGEGDDPIPATVPHYLLDRLGDGTRDEVAAESVTLEQRGTYEWIVSDIIGEQLVQQSLDYVEGGEGYGFSDAGQQVQDLQAVGSVGASVVSADQFLIGGEDLVDTLAPIPRSTRYAMKGGVGLINAGSTASTTELRFFVFDAGAVEAGRLYEVGIKALGQGTVAGDTYWCIMRYTTDGSAPTTSSPVVTGGVQLIQTISAGIVRASVNCSTLFPATADGFLRIAYCFQRLSGTGTLMLRVDAADQPVQVYCADRGVGLDAATALQQTAKTDGSGADNVPVITYTKTFNATWALGWGDYTNVQENSWFWTGVNLDYSSGAYGLIGFDYASIVSTLAASVTPVSCVLRVRPRSRRYSDGLDFRVLTHNNTSLANAHTTWDLYQGDWHGNGSVFDSGVTKLNAAPNVPVDISLGTTIFNQFKAGTRRGVGVAGVSDTVNGSSGTIYGDGAYQAQLIFTYQG